MSEPTKQNVTDALNWIQDYIVVKLKTELKRQGHDLSDEVCENIIARIGLMLYLERMGGDSVREDLINRLMKNEF